MIMDFLSIASMLFGEVAAIGQKNIKNADGKVINKGANPANLLSDKTKNSTDGEIYAFISKGSRTG